MSKKTRWILTPLLVLTLVSTVFASSPKVMVNKETLSVSAINKDGRVLVPLRPIFEALGATVDYKVEASLDTITAGKNGKTIKINTRDDVADIDGKEVKLDVAPCIIKGITYVPARFVAESLGATVVWEDPIVQITLGDTPTETTNKSETAKEPDRGVDLYDFVQEGEPLFGGLTVDTNSESYSHIQVNNKKVEFENIVYSNCDYDHPYYGREAYKLDGKYKSLTGKIALIDNSTAKIYARDSNSNLIYSQSVSAVSDGWLVDFYIDLTGVELLQLEAGSAGTVLIDVYLEPLK